ncbi:hypothetical protein FRB94_002623 [Tulasnella sp. JGI-2019a]|nr:hypothetical protein FRB93_004467 [Tulasnella sp. JGI-2019a]KAG9004191.1 hypothetical protein FRB94_002623 [Tulasnella sp. JGI-2019a]KAG9034636.1 hypothetical protein FRB95_012956 [Tulasnella sp. JGI-2019a]
MPNLQRKYVDLIQRAESKWANWDPSRKQPVVGDYGSVNKDTGAFEWEGSIYSDEFAQHMPKLKEEKERYQPVAGGRDELLIVKSTSVKQLELSATPGVNISALADASVKGSWQFNRGRGAVLVVNEPRILELPRNILLADLTKIPLLKDQYLVTQVVQCPAYAFYLSDKKGDQLSLALSANVPVPFAPGVGASADAGGSWWSQSGSGVLKQGGQKGGTDEFTPLFTLKMIRKPFISFRRDSPPPIREGDDLWRNADEPWGPLDSDGEDDEIVIDDDIPDW